MNIRRVKFTNADVQQLVAKTPPKAPDDKCVDFTTCVVQKPWGREHLMHRNNFVEIWNLSINAGHATSMHCHPNKKTGLILLAGQVSFSTLEGNTVLRPLDSVIIEAGTFHQTKALSDGVSLIEVETPPAKHDLIRLRDDYGRRDKGYEGKDRMAFGDAEPVRFTGTRGDIEILGKTVGGCRLSIKKIGNAERAHEHAGYISSNELVIVLEGIVYGHKNDELYGVAEILPAKDLLNPRAPMRMFNVTLLGIQQNTQVCQLAAAKTFWSKLIRH
ncbi:MAG: hypothetical protein HYW56_02500 [Candidatus Harrisonbacteria bacterium]|nr:hypothetical protein [Candidatus Harrisonbacteria bacterium]